jgi:hypothetical protein
MTYALETNQFTRPRELWSFRFNFTADNDNEAAILAVRWAKYQGRDVRDVRATFPSPYPDSILENENINHLREATQ